MRYRDRTGKRRQEPTGTSDWQEAQRNLQARDDNILEIVRKGEQLLFQEWADFFLEHYSRPPIRAPKTHQANMRAGKHLMKAFGPVKLAEISAERIEGYLRKRLRQHVRIKTAAGIIERGELKPSTVHQEFRVLKRMLNVAVRKKLLPSNACSGAEFPVMVRR